MKNPLFQRLKSCFKSSDSSSSTAVSKNSLHSTSTSPSTSSIAAPSKPPPPSASSSGSHHTTLRPQNGISFTLPELQALQHWSLYGQPGYNAAHPGPQKRVVKGDWKTKDWERVVRGVWVVRGKDGGGEGDAVGDEKVEGNVEGEGESERDRGGKGARSRPLRIRGDVLRVLERGFKPREMEDKWFVYCESMDLNEGEVEKGGNSERDGNPELDGETEPDEGIRSKNAESKEGVLVQEDIRPEGDDRELNGRGRKARNPLPERKIRMCFCRSWTGKRIVEIEIEISTSRRIQMHTQQDEEKVNEDQPKNKEDEHKEQPENENSGEQYEEEGFITAIAWDDIYPNTTQEECQENAKEKVKEVCRWVLGEKIVADEDE